MGDKFLTVGEFAIKVGVSRQAIYKRLTTDLKEFVKVDNGIKVINAKALELYDIAEVDNQVNHIGNHVDNHVDNVLSQDILEILKKQLEQKDNQIQELSSRLEEVTRTLSQQQQLQLQQQKLLEPILEQKKLSFWEKIFSKK